MCLPALPDPTSVIQAEIQTPLEYPSNSVFVVDEETGHLMTTPITLGCPQTHLYHLSRSLPTENRVPGAKRDPLQTSSLQGNSQMGLPLAGMRICPTWLNLAFPLQSSFVSDRTTKHSHRQHHTVIGPWQFPFGYLRRTASSLGQRQKKNRPVSLPLNQAAGHEGMACICLFVTFSGKANRGNLLRTAFSQDPIWPGGLLAADPERPGNFPTLPST